MRKRERARLRELARGLRADKSHAELLDDDRVLVVATNSEQLPVIGLELDDDGEDEHEQPARVITRSGPEGSLLEMLVFPVKPQRFLDEFWEQRALHIRSGGRERLDNTVVEDFLLGYDVEQLLNASPSEEIHVWLKSKGDGPAESFKAEPSVALQCYRTGSASLYFRAPQPIIDAFVSALGMALESNFGCWDADGSLRGEIETFVSRRGNVTHYHMDFQENFTMQLRGVKKWTLRRSGVSTPMRGFTPHFSNLSQAVVDQQFVAMRMDRETKDWSMIDCISSSEEESVIVLEPGDIFYHPSGMLHRVETLEDSISINISMDLLRYSDYFTHLASMVARRLPELRQHVRGRGPALAERLRLFQSAVASLSPEMAFPPALWRDCPVPLVPQELPDEQDDRLEDSEDEFPRRRRRIDLSVSAFRLNPLTVALEGRDEEDGAWFRFSFNSGNEDMDSWLHTEFFMDDVNDANNLKLVLQILSEDEPLMLPDEIVQRATKKLVSALSLLVERGVLLEE